MQTLDHPLDRFLTGNDALHVAADGQMLLASTERCPPAPALLPGSFNPIHRGHWELARVAEAMLGMPVAFELSVANVDKPPLDRAEIMTRLAPFNWQASVWLTHAPTFAQKAEHFPGSVFVVGADTAQRVVAPRYYGDDPVQMTAALTKLRDRGCRFLVACRADHGGKCLHVDDLAIPSAFADLFEAIPAARFRWDVSSTQLRGQQAAGSGQQAARLKSADR